MNQEGYELLTIDHPMLGDVKARLNDAIALGISAARDSATATITLKMEIDSNEGMIDIEDGEKFIDPIAFSATVSTKKKVLDRKGTTQGMVAKRGEEGFEVATNSDQVSMVDGDSHAN